MACDGCHILIVDDEKVIIDLLSEAFQGLGCRTFSAAGVVEALEIIEKERIDLVITDMRMPGIHGLTLVQWAKANSPLCTVPVIVITGHKGERIIEALYQSGVRDIVYKPFTVEVLCEKLRNYFPSLTLN